MEITFEEVLRNKEWLHSEMKNSLPWEVIEKALDDQFYDVKLLVNGVELEPVLFNTLMNNIEKVIKNEGRSIVNNRLSEAKAKVNRLHELYKMACCSIQNEFDLEPEDIDGLVDPNNYNDF